MNSPLKPNAEEKRLAAAEGGLVAAQATAPPTSAVGSATAAFDPFASPTPAPTTSPTSYPTPSPTPYPTAHPCDDGSHGCDQTVGGICYTHGSGNDWRCDCAQGYYCTNGCTMPHSGHECVAITATPTASPTAVPSASPTPAPTAEPTPEPTTAPEGTAL